MPTLTDALHFVQDPQTTAEQLQRACRILNLEYSGDTEELRSRLLEYLHKLDIDEPVICLNPKIIDAVLAKQG